MRVLGLAVELNNESYCYHYVFLSLSDKHMDLMVEILGIKVDYLQQLKT